MTKKPDRLRADYLSGSGIFGQFIFPYWEELDKTKFFLKTMEDFVANSEKEEVSALKNGTATLTPEQKDEYRYMNSTTRLGQRRKPLPGLMRDKLTHRSS